MGNDQSSTVEGELYNPDEYIFISSINDGRYGEIKVLKNRLTNFQVCEVNKTLSSEASFDKHKERAHSRKELNHPNIIKLINFNAFRKEEFCSNFWKLSFLYEYVDHDLKREIERRSKNNQYFQEGDLWYILSSATDALLYLKNKKASHGDVRPYTILISREGNVKFSENFQFNKQISGYQQCLMNIREELYLSPQFYAALKDKEQEPKNADPSKNEVFALGLSLLEAATLKSTVGIYDAENFQIKEQVLASVLDLVQQQYGSTFYQILQLMLMIDENQRKSFEELDEFLKQARQEQWWSNIVPNRIRLADETQQQVPEQDQRIPDSQNQSPLKPEPVILKVDNQQPTEVFSVDKYAQLQQTPTQNVLHQSYSPVVRQSQTLQQQQQQQLQQQQQQQLGQGYVQSTTANYHYISQPQIQTQTQNQYQYENFTQPIDYTDLDARINAVLAMSRETVLKYGGNKVLEEYERAHQQYPTSYTSYERYQPSISENKTYFESRHYDIPSSYKVVEEKSYQQSSEPTSYTTQTYVKNIDTGYQRLEDFGTYKLNEQPTNVITGYTESYKPSIIPSSTANNQNFTYSRPEYSIPTYSTANDYQKISYQNVSESINLKRSTVGSKDYNIPNTTAQPINFTSNYVQNGSNLLNQSTSTNNIELRNNNIEVKTLNNETRTLNTDIPLTYHQTYYTTSNQQQQQQQQQQLNSSRRESPYKPTQQFAQEVQQQTNKILTTTSTNNNNSSNNNNYQNYSDLDLDAEIKKSLQRSKEVEELVNSTRKTLDRNY